MLDLYQSCPCHTERKLKFCCGKDVVTQLSKVIDMFEGGQRIKGVQTLDRAIEQSGYRDCLTGIRFATLLEDEDPEGAVALCEAYVRENGETSVAWTMRAMMAMSGMEGEDGMEVVDHIQSALETGEPVSNMLSEAMLSAGMMLGKFGYNVAARDHLALYVTLTGDPQGAAVRSLDILRQALSTYPPVKHDWPCVPIPEGRPWSEAAAQALHWAEKGLWRKALSVLLPLAQEQATEPVLWKNVAILAGRLAKLEIVGLAWQQYAQCPGVSHDHAVEAELLHILNSDVEQFETYTEARYTYDVLDVASLVEQAESDPQIEVVPDELLQPLAARRNEVPQAILFTPLNFWDSGDGTDVKPEPTHRMAMVIYGKTTDGPAELVLACTESAAVSDCIEKFLQRYPQVDQRSMRKQVVGQPLRLLVDFTPHRLVGLKPLAEESETVARSRDLSQRLPDYATRLLEGRTFREAVQLPEMHRRIEALLLLLECELSATVDIRSTIHELRAELQLPPLPPIEPKTVRLPDLSLQQFTRLNFTEMPARMLAWATNLALSYSLVNALRGLLVEIERRLETAADEIREVIPLQQVYLMMAKIEGQDAKSCEYLDRGARELPLEPHLVCDWLVQALEVCVSRRHEHHFRHYLAHLADLAEIDEYCAAAMIKICSLLGIPGPSIEELRGSSERRMDRGDVLPAGIGRPGSLDEARVATAAAPSQLWLPDSQ